MKFIYFCSLFLFFVRPVVSKNYILTLKNTNLWMNLDVFNDEHNIEELANFGELKMYKTKKENFEKYENTLRMFYYIEEEQEYSVNWSKNRQIVLSNKKNNVPWHLGRVVNKDLPLNTTFSYTECHKNLDVSIETYVIDTGIDILHPEFEERATWLANFVDEEDTDCNSHGTHCAGLIGSKTFGVCKDAKLFAIKVLSCEGSGSTSSVISGIDYAFKRHQEQNKLSGGKTRSIVSMSLGGGYSYALNRAAQETLKDPNFFFAAAAGNENSDACQTSPASAKGIFTVMASDSEDSRAYFSNYGKCADIYSPGVDIESTIPDGETAVYSGTSMSTPVLVGVLNHYVDENPELNMQQLKKKVLSESGKNKITGNKKNTNNYLVYLERN